MQAYIEGTIVSEQMLSRERAIWHDLHLGLNNELDAYKKLVERIYSCESDDGQFVIDVVCMIAVFMREDTRLSREFAAKLLAKYPHAKFVDRTTIRDVV